MNNFNELGLPKGLISSLARMNFEKPTEIQAQAIPVALEGRDIIGTAQTGTGKTGAFGIPLAAYMMNNKEGIALVLTPTRELATQVLAALKQMVGNEIKTALLIGGDSMEKQLNQLRQRPRLVVGTPGRINDHLRRKSLKLQHTKFLVLDETDRMLDMGFGVQLEAIAEHLPEQRQTMMFSATMPNNIVKLAGKYLIDPVRITVGSTTAAAPKVRQEAIHLNEEEKYEQLLTQLDKRDGSIIVFVATKRGADKMVIKLRGENHQADAIHGDLRQNKRDRVIKGFRDKKYKVLVATDVAARGLDIHHVEHVINYDLPQCPEDYIHRIGRTGRAGSEGDAINLISPKDRSKWRAISIMMNPDAKIEKMGDEGRNKKKKKRDNRRFFGDKKRRGPKRDDMRGPFKKKGQRGQRQQQARSN